MTDRVGSAGPITQSDIETIFRRLKGIVEPRDQAIPGSLEPLPGSGVVIVEVKRFVDDLKKHS